MMHDVRQEFAAVVSRTDDRVELDRGALLIAKSIQPEIDIDHYLHLIDLMAEHVALRTRGLTDPRHIIRELNRYLFDDEKFKGNTDTYYDPRNSFLNEVLDRRVGIPVALSILYMELARRLEFKLEGVGLPGHFIIRHTQGGEELFIDPFNQGALLTEEDCRRRLEGLYGDKVPFDRRYLQPVARKRILTRMLNNLKAIFLHAQDPLSAVQMVELILCVDPDSPDEVKARGLLYLQLECFGQACADLERYIALSPESDDLEAVQKYLLTARELTAKLN